ncbi:hypothetical protein [Photobacterium galatheae]|uniref:DUF4136 domain-containing protein n=1 Tax=Photobacterium galatheae TaxID=1654360 RepID=A0A066RRM0_9GAMM|nr:hypothetical protein [Photobacterium galatheae]KDM90327.1 hypothetical protein EA58_17685 [Photobacterium galatheae]MCM0150792.1 hypothetical protein [Photobacterium galatheae]
MQHLLILVLFLGLSGCSTLGKPTFNVVIDSLTSDTAPHAKTYVVLPGQEGVSVNDLQFKEYSASLVRVLQAKGYVAATTPEAAEQVIFLSYGIGEPQTQHYSYQLPTWGQTGVAFANSYKTTSTFGSMTSQTGTTMNTPSYGITGYQTYTASETTYLKYVQIEGVTFDKQSHSEAPVPLWKTTVFSSDTQNDLRRVFPVLVAASVPYLATNTGQKIHVALTESDAAVQAVKGLPLK